MRAVASLLNQGHRHHRCVFNELGQSGSAARQAISMDMGAAFLKSAHAPGHAPQAVIGIDPFHAVKLVTDALGVLRRAT